MSVAPCFLLCFATASFPLMEELYVIYRITRVVLLLSNKYNKSSKVLLELSKERHQALLFKVLSLPQIDLNMPREETPSASRLRLNTTLYFKSPTHFSTRSLCMCKMICVLLQQRKVAEEQSWEQKDQIMAAAITHYQNL